jgi:essential nuclear protein 1
VLAKVKVPLLHSSAALIRLAGMDYSGTFAFPVISRDDHQRFCTRARSQTGPTSLFIRVLLDKKHALPYKVLDALVFHFIRLANTNDPGTLPVLWHQSLLVLCQRYAAHLAPEQKDALRDVVRTHPHAQIAPEVRRELAAAPARGEPAADAMDVS